MIAIVVAEAVAIGLLALLVTGLLRSHAEILRSLHELGAGADPDGRSVDSRKQAPTMVASGTTVATDITGTTLDGSAVAIAVAGTRHDTLLAFLSTGCVTCRPFWEALASRVDVPGGARLVVVVQDEESPSRLRQLAAPHLTVVASSQAWESYEVPGSPHFVYVDGPAGRVHGEGTGADWDAVVDLLSQARADDAADQLGDARDNAARVDAELARAGIGPGHPSLYLPDEGRG